MKRVFKNLVFVFLFAVISILGLASVNAASKNIEVTDIRVINMSDTITVSKPTVSNGEISSSIKFNELDDFVIFELTLKNNESDKYKIVSITDNKENDNVDIEYNYNENYIGKDEITKVTIKMTYKNKLVNKDLSLDDLSITLGLEKEDGSSSQITINPQTGDNILHYVALFIISGLGLFFVITKKRIKGFKAGNLLLIISAILIPFAVLANEKYELSLKFTNSIEVKGEFEEYDISIDSDNGEDAVVRKITYGEKIGDLPEVSKTGYNFVRWEDKDGNEITENTVITKQIEVKAKYNIIEYEITYDLNNGELPSGKTNPTKYTVESDDITLVNPEIVGYTFAGWTGNDIDEKQLVVTIEKGTIGNKSYVANYTANDDTAYKVIHKTQKLDETYETKETENKEGTTDKNVTPAVNTYTGFTSPEVQTKKIKGDGTTEFVYEYTRNKYQLTIEDAKYVEQDKSGKHYYEEEITLKAKTRSGYTFAGWSNGSESKEITITMGTEDITIKPLYTANTDTTYTVIHKYKKLDNTYETVEKTEVGTTDEEVEAPFNSKYGFVDPEVQKVVVTGDGEASVTYIYERAKFQFSITDRTYLDSTSTPNGEYPYETEITLKAKSRDGYTFKWNDDVTEYDRTFNLNADNTSLSLKYTANKYNVVFNKNSEEATGEMSNQELTYDTAQNLTKNSFERLGYTFDGWNTKIDGTGTSYADEEEVINLATEGTFNLFAKWKANTNTAYKIIHKYKKLDDTFEIEEVNGTGTTNTEVPAPIKHKDHFIDPEEQNITIAPDGEASVTYIYEREPYTVTFNTNGGSNIDSQTVLYEAKATRPEGTPYLFDREFDDWYTDSGLETKFDFENTKITADTTIYAKYIDTCNGFSSDSWSTIKANVENDPNHYPLGCRKEVQLDMDNNNTPETYKVRIANRSTPNVCATEGYSQTACGFVIEFEETVGKRRMNNSDTVAGGWKETEIVTYLNGEFYNKLPSDLKNAIIPTYPIVSGSGNDLTSDNITEEDTNKNKIYFFSTREVGFGGQFDNKANIETDTRVLDYYIGTAENSSHEDRRVKYNLNNAAQYWMLRTADLRDDNVYLAVSKGGALSSTTAGENYAYNYAMAPAFRIAIAPKYTVTFETNGGSEIESQSVFKGNKVIRPEDPTRGTEELYDWYADSELTTKFDFENTVISKDTVIYARYKSSFATDSWETIKNNLVSDSNFYAVGSEKEVKLDIDDDGQKESYTVRLANTSTPEVCNNPNYSQTACGYVIEFVDLLGSKQLNDYLFQYIGWGSFAWGEYDLDFTPWLNEEFYNKLPSDLKDVIIPTYPIVFGESDGCRNTVDIDEIGYNRLYLPSTREVGFDAGNYDSASNINTDTRTLDYYAVNNADSSRIKKDLSGTKREWWLRSAKNDKSGEFFTVTTTGEYSTSPQTEEKYYAPVFRIGNMPEFTVTFNTDGGTAIASQTIIYGERVAKPANPDKDGTLFEDWYADSEFFNKFDFNEPIFENKTIYAYYKDQFGLDSWATIKENVSTNPNYYPVGSRKQVAMDMDNDGKNELYTVRLANTSTPNECKNSTMSQTGCGIVIEFVTIPAFHRMNASDTVSGGWKQSEMITYLNGEFYNKLPSDLKNIIIPTYPIVSGSYKNSTSVDITSEDTNKNKLYLLSPREIGADSSGQDTGYNNNRTLDYYIGTSSDIMSVEQKRIKKGLSGEDKTWWLRTVRKESARFYIVYPNSLVQYNFSSDDSDGVAPAFRIN